MCAVLNDEDEGTVVVVDSEEQVGGKSRPRASSPDPRRRQTPRQLPRGSSKYDQLLQEQKTYPLLSQTLYL